jgi:hypothetical protein
MNGRVYDPVLGRFLSPDPYVQQPDFSQSLNRYSYCLNNPLIYTDPSGMRVLPGEWEWRYGERQNKPRYHDMDGGGSNPGYWYDSYSGEYRNKFGNIVSYDEVHYNYIIPNSEFTIYLSDILSESIITDPSVLPQSKEDYQKQADDYNNNEKLVETNDTKLKAMLNKIFNMSLGIFDLRVLTTNSGRYGMTSNLLYYNINNNTFVAGYTLPEDGGWGIHISPFALSNDVYFKAYGGHELIHLYHHLGKNILNRQHTCTLIMFL